MMPASDKTQELPQAISAPNFDLGDDHRHLLEEITRNARARFAHDAMQRDLDGRWPDDGFQRLAEMGVLGASVASEYGGAGLDLFSAGLVGQAIGRIDPAVSTSWQSHDNLCVNNLYQNGNEQQRRKYLPGLTDGSQVGAIGMTEPNAGSDALGGMATTAVRDGDAYVLNGSKTFITNGPIADVVLVYGALYFDDCRVPVENLVGEENEGIAVMMSGLDIERAFCSMMVLGMSERAVELSVEYAKSREQFGRPIGDFQMVQSKLAEMYVALETMRGLVYRALAMANAVDAGQGGRGEIHKLSAAAFMYAGEACMRICDEAVQIHGGSGFMRDTEVNRLYRSAKIQEIGGGTKEIRRLIIAREMLAE